MKPFLQLLQDLGQEKPIVFSQYADLATKRLHYAAMAQKLQQ
jgi:hypothetical protein